MSYSSPTRGGRDRIPAYPNYTSLPTSAQIGAIASIPRLCGHGRFYLSFTGSRWETIVGQTIISDAGAGSSVNGYDLTATGTTFVSLISYNIPAGLIGQGEEWTATILIRNNGVYVSGSDAGIVRFSALGASGSINSSTTVTAASRVARGQGMFVRSGTTLIRNVSGVTYTNQTSGDQTLDLGVIQSIEAGFTPGANTNTMRLRFWSLGRFQ